MRFSDSLKSIEMLANEPGIFESVALHGQDYIDLSGIENDAFGVECEEGGFLIHRNHVGCYEVHTLFHPGLRVLDRAKEAAELIFCVTDCREMITRVPVTNKAALRLTQAFGWDYLFTTKNTFNGKKGRCDTNHYRLTLWDWIARSDKLLLTGKEFHNQLDSLGSLSHEDDPIHDRFVGYALLCAQYGCPEKGIEEYNKWAVFTGYAPVSFNEAGEVFFDNVVIRRDGEISCQQVRQSVAQV